MADVNLRSLTIIIPIFHINLLLIVSERLSYLNKSEESIGFERLEKKRVELRTSYDQYDIGLTNKKTFSAV